jgi:hypothetical protein
MQRLASLVLAACLFHVSPADAEPYIAVRTGFKCSQCHVNPTGGGKRTAFGVTYAQTHLFMTQFREQPNFFDGTLSDRVSIGANLRADNATRFEYASSDAVVSERSNSNLIAEANLYVQVDVIPDVLTFYADEILAPSGANRELFGMFRNLPLDSYVKVGRTLLPYGLRLLDDDAFIRNRTGYTYNRHDLGAEVGLEPGPLSLVANVTGSQLSITGSTVFRRFRVGGSYGRNTDRDGDHVFGAFAGVNVGRFTVLAEGDFIDDGVVDRFAGLAELNILIRQGLNFKTTYEFFDRNRAIPNGRDGQERITLGLEPFISPFAQVAVFYTVNRFIPQNSAQNQDQLTLQFHLFF